MDSHGDKLAGLREHGDDITLGESWDWCHDAEGQRVAYVSLDATYRKTKVKGTR